MSVTVRVPATTANVGPGFDAMGIAFGLYGDFTFDLLPAGELEITGCDEEFATEENLAVRAFREVEKALKVGPSGVKMHIQTDIPVSRGLGSSASLFAAGAFAANELYEGGLSKAELLEITTPLEGHPDNLAPAIFGGICASALVNGKAYFADYRVSEKLGFVAMIPNFKLSTEVARKALPKTVDYKDAVFNVARLSMLPKAMETGDPALLKVALDDRLHQPYRGELIRDYAFVRGEAEEAGACATIIGGAGPTLLAVLSEGTDEKAFLAELKKRLSVLETVWTLIPLKVDYEGARAI